MAKIVRKNMKIFAVNATAQQRGVFGSLAAGLPAYSTDPEVIQSLANYESGWFSAILGNNSPAIQDMNSLQFLYAYQLAYLFQAGVPEWNAATTYYTGSFAQSAGVIYMSRTDDNLNNAVSDNTNWKIVGGSIMTAAGDLLYGGTNGNVTRLANGNAGDVLTSQGGTNAPIWNPLLPSGSVTMYMGATAPSGWLLTDGTTIGSAASGATGRANADTAALYALIWNNTSNTDFPIQDSSGNPTTRGANAAADFAANKRMPLPDTRGIWVSGAGTQTISGTSYTKTLGAKQRDAMQGHRHGVPPGATAYVAVLAGSIPSGGGSVIGTNIFTTGDPVADGTNGTPRTGAQTQPANIAMSYIIKI